MVRFPHPHQDPAALQEALVAAGVVGLWTYEAWPDRLDLSASLAHRLGLDPATSARGMPLNALLTSVHMADRVRVENEIHAALLRGGRLEVGFRTVAGNCWLALRGRFDRDGDAHRPRGRGIALDKTEDGSGPVGQHTVNRIAEHAIAMRELVSALRRPALTKLLDGLMIEIGFELARHLRDAPDTSRH